MLLLFLNLGRVVRSRSVTCGISIGLICSRGLAVDSLARSSAVNPPGGGERPSSDLAERRCFTRCFGGSSPSTRWEVRVHSISGRLRQIRDGFGGRACDILSELAEAVGTLRWSSVGWTRGASRSKRHRLGKVLEKKCPLGSRSQDFESRTLSKPGEKERVGEGRG